MAETQQADVQIAIDDGSVPSQPEQPMDHGAKPGGAGGAEVGGEAKCGRLTEWVRGSWNLFFIGLASLVLFFESVDNVGNGEGETRRLNDYAFSVAIISLAFSVVLLLIELGSPGFLQKGKTGLACAACFTIWWIPGAGVLTFKGPFIGTGNGYFSSWAGLIFSAYWCVKSLGYNVGEQSERFLGTQRLRIVASLGACGLVLMFASIDYVDDVSLSEGAYGLAVGVITAFFCLCIAVFAGKMDKEGGNCGKALILVAFVLFVFWAVAAGVLTFKKPFTFTGNGYFATWLGLIFSIFYLFLEIAPNMAAEHLPF